MCHRSAEVLSETAGKCLAAKSELLCGQSAFLICLSSPEKPAASRQRQTEKTVIEPSLGADKKRRCLEKAINVHHFCSL